MKLFSTIAIAALLLCGAFSIGCKATQFRILHGREGDSAGDIHPSAELYSPIVRETTGKLLARVAREPIQQAAYHGGAAARTICFVNLETISAEGLGDFRGSIRLAIFEEISQSTQFEIVNDHVATSGLLALSLRPDDLLMQENKRTFVNIMGQGGTSVDYLLFARITSGTSESNQDMQRDYELTLKLVCTRTFVPILESASIRKEYNSSPRSETGNWFKR